MSVTATGLGELLGMPDLSVQTAIRPGIPASVPDFLSIMALKAAPPAKGAVPGLPVGLPSAGDGNPTAESVQAVPVPGAALDQTDEGADMAFDLQLPAMPAQQSPAPEPKTQSARFAAIAARHRLAADAQPETDTAVPALDTDMESDTPEAPAISPEVLAAPQPAPLPVPPAAPVVVAAPTVAAATTVSPDQVEAEPVVVPGRASPDDAARAAPLPQVANVAADAEAEEAAPLPATNTNAPAVQAPVEQHPEMPMQAMRGEMRAVVEAAEKAGPALRALVERTDSETPGTPAPLREVLPASQTAQAVLAAIHNPVAETRPPIADVAHGQIASNEALLNDLFVGNAVEDQWVDQLAADVQTLVNGDRREAQLHLKPRELGDLFIRLETNGNQAKVHFTVETAAAQGFLADAAPRLQSMMESRGVRLEEASVDVGSGRQDRGEQPREVPTEPSFGGRPRGAASQAETVRAIVRQTAIERFA
ncbi:MAG: flagellar hook-length control protein FliK [Pseudomonadota bacterium]|jgi:flagellar hook-length control protein FliK|nr:flagellar hook-length control protein FliK [Pseudomonadota bacterium]